MKESEMHSLLNNFYRMHYEMNAFLSKEITITPENSEDVVMNAEDVKRLFCYIIDERPEACTDALRARVCDDWGQMLVNWWLIMLSAYHPIKEARKFYFDSFRERGIVVHYRSRGMLGDKRTKPTIDKAKCKRDILLKVLEYVCDFKVWITGRPNVEPVVPLHKITMAKDIKNLPPELDTPRAREYFKKAQEAGFIAKTSTGYKWVTDNKSECSYFCDLCSDALKLSKSESRTNWKPFVVLFGYTAEDFRGAKNGWKNKTGLPARWKEIKTIFE